MKTIINVECMDQELTIINSPVIASGGVHENFIAFNFCEKWDGFYKTAVFYKNEKERYYSLLDSDDVCEIPHEVTDSEGMMYFGVFGKSGEVIRTSKILKYKINKGAMTTLLKPSEPTPDIYQQLLSAYEQTNEAIAMEKAERKAEIAVERKRINQLSRYVTPQMFGAVANADFFNLESLTYWADSNYSVEPNDDGKAIQDAIDYAIENNIGTVYFPNGHYYVKNRTFNIDVSKIRFVGESTSQLISSGLESGAFITLSAPSQLSQYDYPAIPLENLSIKGSYFVNNAYSNNNITGVRINSPDVHCHNSMYNIVIQYFNIGFDILNGYKSSAFNISMIACDIGISCGAGSIIPFHIYNLYIECCALAIYSLAGGYETLFIHGGAFEYNRQIFNGRAKAYFNYVRFEGDLRTCCSNDLEPLYPFNLTDDYNSELLFDNCQFLFLNNYVDNASHWVTNIVIMEEYPEALIYAYVPNSLQSGGITLTNCNFSSENSFKSGSIIISTLPVLIDHFNLVARNNTISDKLNLFHVSMDTTPSCAKNGVVLEFYNGAYMYKATNGGQLSFGINGTTLVASINANLEGATANWKVKQSDGVVTVNVAEGSLIDGKNYISASLNPSYNETIIEFTTSSDIHFNLPIVNII